MIPSSIHEWLYIEDQGTFTKSYLTDMLRTVNREVVEEDEFLSDDLYCWRGGEFKKAQRSSPLGIRILFEAIYCIILPGSTQLHLQIRSGFRLIQNS